MALHFPACACCVPLHTSLRCVLELAPLPLRPPLGPGSSRALVLHSKPHPQVPGSACAMRYTGRKTGATNFRLGREAPCIFMSLSPTFKNFLFPSAVPFNGKSWIKHREAANNKMVRQKDLDYFFFPHISTSTVK